MRTYMTVTGRHGNLSEFWKLSPAELIEWAAALSEDKQTPSGFEGMEIGEEVED